MAQNDISTANVLNMEKKNNEASQFTKKLHGLNALACNNIKNGNFDISNALKESDVAFKALGATDSLQEMLVAQMLSIHNLQQTASAMANGMQHQDTGQYFTNTAIKLANCFTQQAVLLAKLQGIGGQKIIVEHVEVHHGGQAIVGSIARGTLPAEIKK